jgi:adenylyltransferase/sulfurtransferase
MALDRYHRQTILPGIGEAGQTRLNRSHAIIIGCGALGCVAADLLARAGVGTLTLIDRDIVERTNLQRQTLFEERDADEHMPKAVAAKRRLVAVNQDIAIRSCVTDFSAVNAERLLDEACPSLSREASVVLIDGSDNFETRYLVNDLAVKRDVPLVYAGVVGTSAMAMSILPEYIDPTAPCLRCVFREPPLPGSQPTCDTAGVLGPVVSIIAGYQACEAMKILVGQYTLVHRSLLSFDAWHGRRSRLDLAGARDPDCPCCRSRSFAFLDRTDSTPVASLCGQGAVQISPTTSMQLNLDDLHARLTPFGTFRRTEFLVIGELTEERSNDGSAVGLAVFADGRAQVRGLRSPERARAVYARFVGA